MRTAFVVAFAVGLIVAVFGVIWALQGFGVLGGSPMSNTTTWSINGPITVLIGTRAFLNAWRIKTAPSRRPLARAATMYSCWSTSISAERIWRVRTAARPAPRVSVAPLEMAREVVSEPPNRILPVPDHVCVP